MNVLYRRPLPFQTRQGSVLAKSQPRSAPLLSALPIIAFHHKKQEIFVIKNNSIAIYGLTTLRERCRIPIPNSIKPEAMECCNDDGDEVVILGEQSFCKLALDLKKKTSQVVWISNFHLHEGAIFTLFRENDSIYFYTGNRTSSDAQLTLNLTYLKVSDGNIETSEVQSKYADKIIQKSRKNPEEYIFVHSKCISVGTRRGRKTLNLETALKNGYYNCIVNQVLAITQDDEGRVYILLDWLNLSHAISGGFPTSNYLLVSLSNVFSNSSFEEEGNVICCEERSHLYNQFTFRMEFFKYEKKKYLCFFKNELNLVTVSYQEINNGYHLFKNFIYPYVDMLIVCGH